MDERNRDGAREREEIGGELVILILAAGSSSRMGQSKQLLLVEGEPLLQKTVNVSLQAALGKVVVVLGAKATQHQQVLYNFPVEIIVHEHWQNGIGSSLKAGMKYMLKALPHCKAVIILVCDQPFLTAAHLQQLAIKFSSTGKPLIASAYANTLGVPCLFAKEYFTELLTLGDDEGAKKIIQKFRNDVASVPFPKGEIDLDTPADYITFRGF